MVWAVVKVSIWTWRWKKSEEEIIKKKIYFNHRAIATFIEVLAFLYWFFNTLQKYIYVQNSRCVLFWNHFFSQWCTPPKKTKETILYKECKWKLWKVKYENVFKITVVSAITRPSTDRGNKKTNKEFMNVSENRFGKAFPAKRHIPLPKVLPLGSSYIL